MGSAHTPKSAKATSRNTVFFQSNKIYIVPSITVFVKRLVVVIPTKNEERAISGVIGGVPVRELALLGLRVQTLVVDGNSSDRTRELAEKAGARVIMQTGNGKGNGLKAAFGFLSRNAPDYAVFLDGDASYSPRDIPFALMPLLLNRSDVVIGARNRQPGSMSLLNTAGNRLLTFFARFAIRKSEDLCSGFWAFNRKAIRKMNPVAESFDIEADMFAETRKRNLRVSHVPVSYSARTGATKLNPLVDGGVIAFRILRRVRDWNPLALYGSLGVIFMLSSAVLGYEVVADFLRTGSIVKVPRTIVSGFLLLFGMLFFGYGLMMDYIEREFNRLSQK